MFIQMLEGLHQDEAKVLLGMKSKTLNKMYKGLTESVVKEAFGWNDNFMRPEPEQKQNKTTKKSSKIRQKSACLEATFSVLYTNKY